MGASGWDYYTDYQPDLNAALNALRDRVFAEGDYWWAVPGEFGKSAADFPDRPRTTDELWNEEAVRECGTHSILDVDRVVDGAHGRTGTIVPVTAEEALATTGTEKPTRAHTGKLDKLVGPRWSGRVAVLHDDNGTPSELYFFGISGD
ncbi:hypothetical protein [Paractinoplanes atraurantiacus]|uniref:Uncharacterized protein n=1 Tax=Paractinoplanes atraurantiacus TaxID=1036182 RepID=A0A285J4A0_9ACTN|nr:hypothetical protein [Actinoplanes atraurantiacus]SNY55149.1 hypothetical protein SAMN05421748_11655 [Actinoplanes atraurantiacus]